MSLTRSVLAIVVATIVLFLWNGLTQFFPWGLGTVNQLSATSGEPYAFGASRLEQAPPGTWTTEAFEDRLGDGISTLATDRSFSWIVAVPRERYDVTRYFVLHIFTQAGIALFLVVVLWLVEPLPRPRRVASVLAVAAAAMVATYGTMMNWWGLAAGYGVGSSVNLLVGWLLAFLVIDRLVLGKRIRNQT